MPLAHDLERLNLHPEPFQVELIAETEKYAGDAIHVSASPGCCLDDVKRREQPLQDHRAFCEFANFISNDCKATTMFTCTSGFNCSVECDHSIRATVLKSNQS